MAKRARGPEHPETADALNNLGFLFEKIGRLRQSRTALSRKRSGSARRSLALEHPDTATSLNNLAVLYHDMREYAKAEPLYQEALRIRQKVLG